MRIKKSVLAGAALVTLACVAAAPAVPYDPNPPVNTGGISSIELSTGICEGSCPEYMFSISHGDIAHYTKYDITIRSGSYTAVIDFDKIAEWLATQPLPTSNQTYNSRTVDAPGETFTITRGDRVTVLENDDASASPPLLFGLRQFLDHVRSEADWWPDGPETKFMGYFTAVDGERVGIAVHVAHLQRKLVIDAFGPDWDASFFGSPLEYDAKTATINDYEGRIRASLADEKHITLEVGGKSFLMQHVDVRTFYRKLNTQPKA